MAGRVPARITGEESLVDTCCGYLEISHAHVALRDLIPSVYLDPNDIPLMTSIDVRGHIRIKLRQVLPLKLDHAAYANCFSLPSWIDTATDYS